MCHQRNGKGQVSRKVTPAHNLKTLHWDCTFTLRGSQTTDISTEYYSKPIKAQFTYAFPPAAGTARNTLAKDLRVLLSVNKTKSLDWKPHGSCQIIFAYNTDQNSFRHLTKLLSGGHWTPPTPHPSSASITEIPWLVWTSKYQHNIIAAKEVNSCQMLVQTKDDKK